MATETSSGGKPRLDIFIPKKMKRQCIRSGSNGGDGARHTNTGQSSPSKTQNTRKAIEDSMNLDTLQAVHPASPRVTDQFPDEVADKDWTKDRLRLLHKTLTDRLQLADTRSEVIARAGSGTAVLQRSSPSDSLPVRQTPGLSQHSSSSHSHNNGKTDCNAAVGLADGKTGIMADFTANVDTTSLNTVSTTSSSQDSVAHSTGCKSPGDSRRSEPFASGSSPTAVQHRQGTSLSSGRHHPKKRSDKPASSQRPHKSCRRSRFPKQSRLQTAEGGTQRTGQSSPARKHPRSPSMVCGKHAASSSSPARGGKAVAPTSKSPDRPSLSAAKIIGSSKPKGESQGSLRRRHSRLGTRRYRSPSRDRSPYLGNRAARSRSPAKGHFVGTRIMERQPYAEAGECLPPTGLQALTDRSCCGLLLMHHKVNHIIALFATHNHIAFDAMPRCASGLSQHLLLHCTSHRDSQ